MYMACRHIKPNGLRCQSPALRGHAFCYFHSKIHNLTSNSAPRVESIRLPVPEDPAAIQISIAQIANGLLSGSIDPKLGGRLLYAMRNTGSQHAKHHYFETARHSVESMTRIERAHTSPPSSAFSRSARRPPRLRHSGDVRRPRRRRRGRRRRLRGEKKSAKDRGEDEDAGEDSSGENGRRRGRRRHGRPRGGHCRCRTDHTRGIPGWRRERGYAD